MPLFTAGTLRSTLENHRERMLAAIDAHNPNTLLNTPEDTLADYFVSEYEVDPLVIAAREDVTVEVVPTKVDARYLPNRAVWDRGMPVPVDGTLVRVRVPFTGDPILFGLQASTWSPNHPQGELFDKTVVFERTWGSTPPNDEVARWVDEEVSRLRQHVGFQAGEVQQHNAQLRPTALQRIRDRRSHLLASQNLQASLPFRMHPRPDAPLTFVPEGVKKKSVPLPLASAAPYRPEPALSDEQFEDILRTIRAMGRSMERTPGAYSSLGEEDLRSVFLTSLNAQFEGGATGETFNVTGKTDILIRQGDRNLFIGECKVWDGPKTLTDAIDQVLGYLAWRDTRVAVVIFVRRKDFGAVVEKIPTTVTQHPHYRREVGRKGAAEWHYRFVQPGDPTRELTLAVIAFHLPQAVGPV